MSKLAVIYWTGTGNTGAMAQAVADGAKGAGAEAELRMIQSLYAREGFAHPAHLQQKFRHTLNASIQ